LRAENQQTSLEKIFFSLVSVVSVSQKLNEQLRHTLIDPERAKYISIIVEALAFHKFPPAYAAFEYLIGLFRKY